MSRALVISVLCCCCTNCWISKCLNIYVYDPKCGVNSPDNQISRDRERESERAACRRSAAVLQCCRLQSRQTSLATNTAVQAASETFKMQCASVPTAHACNYSGHASTQSPVCGFRVCLLLTKMCFESFMGMSIATWRRQPGHSLDGGDIQFCRYRLSPLGPVGP